MIPKIIHYCWFGGNPLPELAQKCKESWKKYCPDYEIIQWNESNYDVTKNQYMYEAYQAGKWGFVPDYARLDIVYQHGGLYFDTDVELIKPIDELLGNKAFMGFEDGKTVAPGLVFGAEPQNETIKWLMDSIYENRSFYREDGSLDLTPSPKMNTEILLEKGLIQNNLKQTLGDLTIYPTDYFCPMDMATRKISITQNTYSIHHYDGSWLTDEDKYRIALRAQLCKRFPIPIAGGLARAYTVLKIRGIKAMVIEMKKRISHNK